ncbi:unnamed protein product [Strongylus vulgaris]|uniref:Uncharacterized protein n=1 Tax=Strongylus vulgaris TaxID=40348 RepID=A0A3P7KUA1_STRVU|nr:unnamed protein product [Strongylus vulgaris]
MVSRTSGELVRFCGLFHNVHVDCGFLIKSWESAPRPQKSIIVVDDTSGRVILRTIEHSRVIGWLLRHPGDQGSRSWIVEGGKAVVGERGGVVDGDDELWRVKLMLIIKATESNRN